MENDTVLKVYNKQNKINVITQASEAMFVVSIYKYTEKEVYKSQFSFLNEDIDALKRNTYFDLSKIIKERLGELISINVEFVEVNEFLDDTSTIRTTINLKSGNVYETKTKYFDGEVYKVERLNGEVYDFPIRLQEDKINEYLNKTKDNE